MAGFFYRHFSLCRSQIMGRGLTAMRVRLARKKRVIRRMRRSLKALQNAAAEIEVRNWRIGEENELVMFENTLANLLVQDCLVELENDPLMRNAFERFSTQNLDGNVNQAQPFRDDGASGDLRQ